MDADPFAVWGTPAASTSQTRSKDLTLGRLSLDDSGDDEPGWGLPSPQKSRLSTPAVEQPDEVAFHAESTEIQEPPTLKESFDDDDDDDDDGFQDFDQPSAATQDGNDDFGDFDDFEQGELADDAVFDEDEVPAPVVQADLPTRSWDAINVTTATRRDDIAADVAKLLPTTSAEQELTSDVLRQVPGESQVLVADSSRTMWKALCTMPDIKPIDWVRSKTRRDYLISMGIPVNLDEIHASSATSRSGNLPPLKLDLGNVTSGDSASGRSPSSLSRSATPSRNGTGSPALGSSSGKERLAEKRREELGLAAPPVVDMARAQELVDKTESQLTLLSLPALRSMLRDLQSITNSTSVLLTHHLTLRESYQADSEMYNSMIKQLVTGAASRVGSAASTNSNVAHGLRGGAVDRRATTGYSGASVQRHPTPPTRNASINRSSATPNLRGGANSKP